MILNKVLGLEEMEIKIDFRNYRMFSEIDGQLVKFQDIANTLCISSADAEKGFSQMNLIINEMRSIYNNKNINRSKKENLNNNNFSYKYLKQIRC